MKYKYQKYLNMFSKSFAKINVDLIGYKEIGHIDMNEFLECVEKAPSKMTSLIASGVHQYASFPISTHDLEFVLAVVDCFDTKTRQVKDATGNVVIFQDSEFINIFFKGPTFEEVVDNTLVSAQAHYEENLVKCKKAINIVFLSTARHSTTTRWTK